MSLWTDLRDTAFSKAKEAVGDNFFDTTREKSKSQPPLTASPGAGEALSPTARESYAADNTGSSRPASDKPLAAAGFQVSKPVLIGGVVLLVVALYFKGK